MSLIYFVLIYINSNVKCMFKFQVEGGCDIQTIKMIIISKKNTTALSNFSRFNNKPLRQFADD